MGKIRIRTRDVFGNIHYLYTSADGSWRAALANGIPYSFHQAAHAEDEMALRFDLEDATTVDEVLSVFKRHANWEKAEFDILNPKGALI